MRNNRLLIYLGIGFLIMAFVGLSLFRGLTRKSEKATLNTPTPTAAAQAKTKNITMQITKPELTIDKAKKYTAKFETSEGSMSFSLSVDKTPITVNNFVYLSKKGFYANTIFHRVMSGFMIQGGDPEGTGRGGPGYTFDDEPFEGEYTRGTLAMANAGPDTNGSQFFIVHKDTNLPRDYVIFGKLIDGLDTLDKIANSEVTIAFGGEKSKPVSPTKILSIDIIEE